MTKIHAIHSSFSFKLELHVHFCAVDQSTSGTLHSNYSLFIANAVSPAKNTTANCLEHQPNIHTENTQLLFTSIAS